MKFTNNYKINEKPLHSFYKEGNFELPKRLWEKGYALQFNVLKNCYLVRNFEIKYRSTSDHIYLIKQDQFDEN